MSGLLNYTLIMCNSKPSAAPSLRALPEGDSYLSTFHQIMTRQQEIEQIIAADRAFIERSKKMYLQGRDEDITAYEIVDKVFLIEHNTKVLKKHLERKKKKA
jgi:hypothetical protein